MIKQNIYLDEYDWGLLVFYDVKEQSAPIIIRHLIKGKRPAQHI